MAAMEISICSVVFSRVNPEQLLGTLTAGLAKEGFDTSTLTTLSWQQEIRGLQKNPTRTR